MPSIQAGESTTLPQLNFVVERSDELSPTLSLFWYTKMLFYIMERGMLDRAIYLRLFLSLLPADSKAMSRRLPEVLRRKSIR
jgi:hypothetical protein